MIIESTQNTTFKDILALKEKKYRDKNACFIVEGQKQVNEISKNWTIKTLVLSESYNKKSIDNSINTLIITDKLFKKLSSTLTPQGIIAIVEKKRYDDEVILKQSGLVLLLDNIQDPGNLGTIIRSADAFGAKAVFISKNSADIYSEKTIRSTMGSVFNIPVFNECDINLLIKKLKSKKFIIYTAALNAKLSLENVNFAKKTALVIGNESSGISKEIEKVSDFSIKIDMAGKAESLNAAVAASVIMYKFLEKN